MSPLKTIVGVAVLVFQSVASAYTCPTPEYIKDYEADKKQSFSRSQMYAPMVKGAADVSEQIVFVDQNDFGNTEMLAAYPAMNESLFKQYRQESGGNYRGLYNASYAYDGIFKIAYRYFATECRRQLILGKQMRDEKAPKFQNATGKFNGFTAVEICNPTIADLFVAGKKALGAGKMQTVEAFLAFVNHYERAGKIDQKTMTQVNGNLSLSDRQKKAVMFFKDEDGDILPRFAVKITSFYYQQYGDSCSMVIDHKDEADDYAGLATYYKDDYSFEMAAEPVTPSNVNLWYWNLEQYVQGDYEGTRYNYVEVASTAAGV